MLSHVVTLVKTYEQHHGIRPNVVYMNETHYGYLREELPAISQGVENLAKWKGQDGVTVWAEVPRERDR